MFYPLSESVPSSTSVTGTAPALCLISPFPNIWEALDLEECHGSFGHEDWWQKVAHGVLKAQAGKLTKKGKAFWPLLLLFSGKTFLFWWPKKLSQPTFNEFWILISKSLPILWKWHKKANKQEWLPGKTKLTLTKNLWCAMFFFLIRYIGYF